MSSSPRPFLPDEVVLLGQDGRAIGTADRLTVHTGDTPLHQAFSTYLFNDRGDTLLTRRALHKATWPGVWTNSCCGHPRPGEALADAARRRIHEELGLVVGPLTMVLPDFRYRAVDASGIVENELCPVFVGFVGDDEPAPDPDEVVEHAWVPWPNMVLAAAATPQLYSPWSVLQVPALASRLPRVVCPPADGRDGLADCKDDVDALLRAALGSLADAWGRFDDGLGVDVLPRDLPAWLDDLLLTGGKRLRVAMAYWGFVAAGGRPDSPSYHHLVRAAAALETLHLFALIHDDVMDGSTSRRGRPSAHVQADEWHRRAGGVGEADVFGRNLAVLLGDLAHTVADQLVDALPRAMRTVWYELCVELIVGQRADLTGAASGRRDLGHARHVARLKSGCYTVERPLDLGALAAGATDDVRAYLSAYGREVGQAFALRDDMLGVWGEPARTGKPAGDDLAEAKATVIWSLAHERLTGEASEALSRLGTPDARPGDVPRVRAALAEAGIPGDIERRIRDHYSAAVARLSDAHLSAAGVRGLTEAARLVAWRDS